MLYLQAVYPLGLSQAPGGGWQPCQPCLEQVTLWSWAVSHWVLGNPDAGAPPALHYEL